jgi:uncharacterized protein (DUF1330 family)
MASSESGERSEEHVKAYWITFYRAISSPDALAAYAALAVPAIESGGGRILARGKAAHAYEGGLRERTVLVEFPSLEQARTTYESPAYQAAVAKLAGAAERDLRLVEGLE